MIDKAAKRGIIHPNTAARRKSLLAAKAAKALAE
jgi:ribosomal protein S20